MLNEICFLATFSNYGERPIPEKIVLRVSYKGSYSVLKKKSPLMMQNFNNMTFCVKHMQEN